MRSSLWLCTLLLLAAPQAFAGNMRFLNDSVFSEFDKDELTDFKAFVGDKLNTLADTEKAAWYSKTSSLKGRIMPKFTHSVAGSTCRRTLFLLVGEGKNSDIYTFDVCKISDQWKLMHTPAADLKKTDWEILQATGLEALNLPVSGEPISWFNQATRNSGVFVPNETDSNGCRALAISITNRDGISSNGKYLFCKNATNAWERVIDVTTF